MPYSSGWPWPERPHVGKEVTRWEVLFLNWRLGQDVVDHVAMHVSQTEITSLELERKFLLVNTK